MRIHARFVIYSSGYCIFHYYLTYLFPPSFCQTYVYNQCPTGGGGGLQPVMFGHLVHNSNPPIYTNTTVQSADACTIITVLYVPIFILQIENLSSLMAFQALQILIYTSILMLRPRDFTVLIFKYVSLNFHNLDKSKEF